MPIRALFIVWMILLAPALALAERGPVSSSLNPIDLSLLRYLGIESGISTRVGAVSKCNGLEPVVWVPETCKLAAYIKVKAQPFLTPSDSPLAISIKTQIVYFGETHVSQGPKHFMIQAIPALKAQGFTVLALEMFNASQQPILDDYFQNTIDLAAVERALVQSWGYQSDGYLELLKVAKENGLRLLALDHRDSVPQLRLVQNVHWRDEKMVDRITEELKKKSDTKIIIYAGALHAQARLNLKTEILSQSELLRERTGLETTNFTIREHLHAQDPITDLYFQQGSEDPAFLPLDRNEAYSDGMILLPAGY